MEITQLETIFQELLDLERKKNEILINRNLEELSIVTEKEEKLLDILKNIKLDNNQQPTERLIYLSDELKKIAIINNKILKDGVEFFQYIIEALTGGNGKEPISIDRYG